MFNEMGRDPKSPEQFNWFVTFITENIPSGREREFINEFVATVAIPTPKQMKDLFDSRLEYYKHRIRGQNFPTQDDPIETWCKLCMNGGMIPRAELHDGIWYTVNYRCKCKAGERYPWLKAYTEFYPSKEYPADTQFPMKEGEYYVDAYRRGLKKLMNENKQKDEVVYDELPF
jgi:hypothetical protein